MPACAGARVEAILQQDGASEKNLIEIILCEVTDEGMVLLDDHVATASLDIRRSLCTHCNTLQHTATHCNTSDGRGILGYPQVSLCTHCNTLQHTATHCNTPDGRSILRYPQVTLHTLQHTATHCNTLHDGRDTTREIERKREREGKSIFFLQPELWFP